MEKEAAIFLSTSADEGESWTKPRRVSIPGHDTIYPRVVAIDDDFYGFWTETVDGKSVMKTKVF